jgi:hypothetical protein
MIDFVTGSREIGTEIMAKSRRSGGDEHDFNGEIMARYQVVVMEICILFGLHVNLRNDFKNGYEFI